MEVSQYVFFVNPVFLQTKVYLIVYASQYILISTRVYYDPFQHVFDEMYVTARKSNLQGPREGCAMIRKNTGPCIYLEGFGPSKHGVIYIYTLVRQNSGTYIYLLVQASQYILISTRDYYDPYKHGIDKKCVFPRKSNLQGPSEGGALVRQNTGSYIYIPWSKFQKRSFHAIAIVISIHRFLGWHVLFVLMDHAHCIDRSRMHTNMQAHAKQTISFHS